MPEDATYGFPKNDAIELLNLIGNRDVEFSELSPPSGLSGGAAILAVTPVGGIAARTDTTFPLTFPSAVCSRVNPDTGDYFSPNEEVIVYNSTNIAISAQSLIQAKRIGTRWFVDVDNCGDAALDLPEVAEPPPPP